MKCKFGPSRFRAFPPSCPRPSSLNPRPFRPSRQGITLLEVLFAIFVMAIGMLSVASLIPVGKTLLARGAQADRSTACGSAALLEMGLRRYDRPEMWLYQNPLALPAAQYPMGLPFVIDPLFSAANDGDLTAEWFPYEVAGDPIPGLGYPRLNRISVRPFPPTPAFLPPDPAVPISLAMALRLFTCDDDAVFTVPEDDSRPVRTYDIGPDNEWGMVGVDDNGDGLDSVLDAGMAGEPGIDDDGNGLVDDPLELGDDQLNFAGKYSWLITMTPALSEMTPLIAPANRKLYTASVVVVNGRKLAPPLADEATPPAERMVWCTFQSFGYGGGDVRLRLDDAGENHFKLQVNQWIMIAGSYEDTSGSGITADHYRWYRIAALGDPKNDTGTEDADYRDVTLAGPDLAVAPLPATWQPIDGDTSTTETEWVAYILDGAVGVFEKTIEVDQPSLWTH